MRFKYFGFLLSVLFVTSCTSETTICDCYNNNNNPKPDQKLAVKCNQMKKDWSSKYKSGSDSLKKSMDLEFAKAIQECNK